MTLDELTLRYTAAVMDAHEGHINMSAKYMGISPRTLKNYCARIRKDYPELESDALKKKRAQPKIRKVDVARAERERQRMLDLRDKYHSRLYKVKGA